MFAVDPLDPTLGVLHAFPSLYTDVAVSDHCDGAVSDHCTAHVVLVAGTEHSLHSFQKSYVAAVSLGQHDHLSCPADSAKSCHWSMAAHEGLFQTALCQDALCPCLYL